MPLKADIQDILEGGEASQEKLRTLLRSRLKRNISREQIRQTIDEFGDKIEREIIDKSVSRNGKTIIIYRIRE
jgi:hypothetical protein